MRSDFVIIWCKYIPRMMQVRLGPGCFPLENQILYKISLIFYVLAMGIEIP